MAQRRRIPNRPSPSASSLAISLRIKRGIDRARQQAALLAEQTRPAKIPHAFEYRFHPTRLWAFDIAWPSRRVAVEIQGGAWLKRGGHTSGAGMTRDCEKFSNAAALGWRVLPVTPAMVLTGEAARLALSALALSSHPYEL